MSNSYRICYSATLMSAHHVVARRQNAIAEETALSDADMAPLPHILPRCMSAHVHTIFVLHGYIVILLFFPRNHSPRVVDGAHIGPMMASAFWRNGIGHATSAATGSNARHAVKHQLTCGHVVEPPQSFPNRHHRTARYRPTPTRPAPDV